MVGKQCFIFNHEVANEAPKTSKTTFVVTNKFIDSVLISRAISRQIDHLFFLFLFSNNMRPT